jgi:hypothetical protein
VREVSGEIVLRRHCQAAPRAGDPAIHTDAWQIQAYRKFFRSLHLIMDARVERASTFFLSSPGLTGRSSIHRTNSDYWMPRLRGA